MPHPPFSLSSFMFDYMIGGAYPGAGTECHQLQLFQPSSPAQCHLCISSQSWFGRLLLSLLMRILFNCSCFPLSALLLVHPPPVSRPALSFRCSSLLHSNPSPSFGLSLRLSLTNPSLTPSFPPSISNSLVFSLLS